MKQMRLLLPAIFFCCITAQLPAQTYRALSAATEAFYSCSSAPEFIVGLKCDSVGEFSGDSVYYPYRTLAYTSAPVFCNIFPDYPIWSGKEMLIRANGMHVFFTINGDSLNFTPNTVPGDTQLVYTWAPGDLLLAIHVSNSQQTFAAITDSVKTYRLQAVDASNAAVASWWNGKNIVVSKNNGVVSLMSIRDFPLDTLMLERVEAKRLKYGDIYTWQPGDEIHERQNWSGGQTIFIAEDWLINRTVLTRTQVNADSVVFTLQDIVHHTCNMPPINVITIDTVQFSVGRLNTYINEEMPQQTIDSTHWYDLWRKQTDCGHLRMVDHVLSSIFIDTCVHFESFESLFRDSIYVENIGGYYFYEWPHYSNNYSYGTHHFTYFYSDSTGCGHPLYVNTAETIANATSVAFYPNPVTDRLTLEDAAGSQLEIYDVQGRLVLTLELAAGSTDVSALLPGAYFGKVISSAAPPQFFRFVKR